MLIMKISEQCHMPFYVNFKQIQLTNLIIATGLEPTTHNLLVRKRTLNHLAKLFI